MKNEIKYYGEKDAIRHFETAKVVYKNDASNYLRHFCNKLLELRATIGTEDKNGTKNRKTN